MKLNVNVSIVLNIDGHTTISECYDDISYFLFDMSKKYSDIDSITYNHCKVESILED